jgi:ubiquinone/menaquinone biosynthesis C-methylase UbiE
VSGGESNSATARWNRNIHYHPHLLAALPDRCERALDIGCGEGTLARTLRQRVSHVSAIDVDENSIELARQQDPVGDIEYLLGDFLTYPFEATSFDFIVSVAALHHMDATVALQRMRELLRRGGTLAILGLPRSRYPSDLPRDVAATLATSWLRLFQHHWESPAPTVWPPSHTFPEIRALAEHLLPEASISRHLLSRYSLIWTKP